MLRATGKNQEAAELQNAEFSKALAAARTASEADQTEATLLAEEAERVSSACLLAEILAPLLAEHLRGESPAVSKVEVPLAEVAPPEQPAIAARNHEPLPTSVPGIADLIDGMLSQQTAFSGARAR
jgi:hypothetical protein